LPFDLQGTLRRLKPHKRLERLTRRADSELAWASDQPLIGSPLLLDTCVYLDVLQGRTPEAVDELLTYRVCHHSAVCLAELTHVFGRLDPAHPSTSGVLQTIRGVIDDIPRHRLHAPETAMWGEAGMLAGELFRLGGAPKDAGHERKYLNDALIHLQARSIGAGVLTGNVGDFDFLNQLVPGVPIILYRQA
jgi:predicted nucleic acid-binding protein